MLSSVAVTLVQRIQATSVCESKECKAGDEKNTSDTDEKENKTEKDLFAYKTPLRTYVEEWATANSKSKTHVHNKELISSLYTFLPYNPPEA